MSGEELNLIEQISYILAREGKISSEEHMRVLELIRKEQQDG